MATALAAVLTISPGIGLPGIGLPGIGPGARPGAAFAQSVNEFRLPSASPAAAPRVQGPVDADNPVIAAPRPSPRPAPTTTTQPSAAPPPAAAPAAPPGQAGAASGGQAGSGQTASGPARAPRPARQDSTAPGAASTGAALPPAAAGASPPPASATDSPIFSSLPSATSAAPRPLSPPVASRGLPDWVPWAGGGLLGLLAGLAGLLWWRRRQADAPIAIEFERPIVPVVEPAPESEVAPAAPPVPADSAARLDEAVPDGLVLALEARRMSASLMATTLSYRLSLTNRSHETLSTLAIEGDMVAAHGQLPPEQQVARPDQKLELRHALVALAPGETAVFTGDFRVPLELITPIRAGNAAFFVPLARFRVQAGALVKAQTFVVGETPDAPGAALKPFRLDLGPRTYSRIGQRAVG